MRYESKKTPRGNVGVSYVDQQSADAQAAAMDAANCTDCTDCEGCTYCEGCTNCAICANCANCADCADCTGCTDCTYCANCTYCATCATCANCANCANCTYCVTCAKCTYCRYCEGVLIWRGPPATKLLALNGLTWPVATDGYYVQIGCQSHSFEAWQKFNDAEISAMASQALEFWRTYKPVIIAMAEHRRRLTK